MKVSYLLVAATLVASPAFAQAPAPTPSTPAANAQMTTSGQWRASKLIGVNVYNQQDEKLGEINELILTPAGQIAGAVVGVGGFLGMGERNIMVTMDKLKFSSDPKATTGTSASDHRWYPDKAVLNASKDQLKAMSEFKY